MAITNSQQINFAPLDEKPPSNWELVKTVVKRHFTQYLWLTLLIIPAVILMKELVLLVYAVIIGGQVYMLRKAWQTNQFRAFAQLNSFHYQPEVDIMNFALVFDHNSDWIAEDQISGEFNGWPFRMFNYYFGKNDDEADELYGYAATIAGLVPGEANKQMLRGAAFAHHRSKQKEHWAQLGVMEVQLPKKLPHLFLDARGDMAIYARKIDKRRHIKLEGDFNEYFSLYAARDFQVEALDIFSPDFMQFLIDHYIKVDVEFYFDRMLLYASTPSGFIAEYKMLFDIADELTNELKKKFTVWQFDHTRLEHKALQQREPLF